MGIVWLLTLVMGEYAQRGSQMMTLVSDAAWRERLEKEREEERGKERGGRWV